MSTSENVLLLQQQWRGNIFHWLPVVHVHKRQHHNTKKTNTKYHSPSLNTDK